MCIQQQMFQEVMTKLQADPIALQAVYNLICVNRNMGGTYHSVYQPQPMQPRQYLNPADGPYQQFRWPITQPEVHPQSFHPLLHRDFTALDEISNVWFKNVMVDSVDEHAAFSTIEDAADSYFTFIGKSIDDILGDCAHTVIYAYTAATMDVINGQIVNSSPVGFGTMRTAGVLGAGPVLTSPVLGLKRLHTCVPKHIPVVDVYIHDITPTVVVMFNGDMWNALPKVKA